jgi:hypothetical protein
MCFADLSGDASSIHTDKVFARSSAYRENVVHGLLPVMFICALQLCCIKGYRVSFSKVSARFIKPVLLGDELLLNAEVSEINNQQGLIELEYNLTKKNSCTLLTTGAFTLSYSDAIDNKDKRLASHRSILMDELTESNLQFEDISKGDEKKLQFLISETHAQALSDIIKKGLSARYKSDFSKWTSCCNVLNLLSTSLISTFAGMCIPGRYATLTNFSVDYALPVQYNKRYILRGRVSFRSDSTSTIAEDVSVFDPEEKDTLYAIGKMNVKVGTPSIKMESMDYLRDRESDLQLRGKVVLITDASRGIGETCAKLFSIYGAKVCINYFKGKDDAEKDC